jgi:hypothetical protein
MTMNWATQQTVNSHAEAEPGPLSDGGSSLARGLAVASTLTGAQPTAIGDADGW